MFIGEYHHTIDEKGRIIIPSKVRDEIGNSFIITRGIDSIVCVGAIFLASSLGTTFSVINPFSVVIASNAAGTTFTQGMAGRIDY